MLLEASLISSSRCAQLGQATDGIQSRLGQLEPCVQPSSSRFVKGKEMTRTKITVKYCIQDLCMFFTKPTVQERDLNRVFPSQIFKLLCGLHPTAIGEFKLHGFGEELRPADCAKTRAKVYYYAPTAPRAVSWCNGWFVMAHRGISGVSHCLATLGLLFQTPLLRRG